MGRATVLLVFWTLPILFVEVLLLLQGHNFLNSTPSLWFSRFSNSLTEFGQLTNNFVLLTTASYKGKINWIQQLSTINKMNLLIVDYFLKFGDLNRSLSIRKKLDFSQPYIVITYAYYRLAGGCEERRWVSLSEDLSAVESQCNAAACLRYYLLILECTGR